MNLPFIVAGLLGATAIGLGAYGAHGLEDQLAGLGYEGAELSHRIDNFITASHYQLHAATALLVLALANQFGSCFRLTPKLLSGGAVIFCGLLYILAFAGPNWRWLGAIVPIGGLGMMAAWAGIAWVGFRGLKPLTNKEPSDVESLSSNYSNSIDQKTADRNSAGLVRVEELLMHHQQLVAELNEVVTSVRKETDNREERFDLMDKTVRRLVEMQQAAEDRPDDRPPHY